MYVIDSTAMEAPKTKHISNFLAEIDLDGRVLFIGESALESIQIGEETRQIHVHTDRHDNFVKSTRNMPGVRFKGASALSGYDILRAQHLVLTEEALRELERWLCHEEAQEQVEEGSTHE
jgi:large subunit ribosomal protein L4